MTTSYRPTPHDGDKATATDRHNTGQRRDSIEKQIYQILHIWATAVAQTGGEEVRYLVSDILGDSQRSCSVMSRMSPSSDSITMNDRSATNCVE